MRRLLLLAALSMVATLAFSSVAMSQQNPEDAGPCRGAAEELGLSGENLVGSFAYVPEVNGCFVPGGAATGLVGAANSSFVDADTGEELGVLKEIVNLQAVSFLGNQNTYTTENYCDAFPALFPTNDAFTGYLAPGSDLSESTAGEVSETSVQEYLDTEANAQEREILDPDGDGVACTDEDLEFAASGGMASGGGAGMTEPTTPGGGGMTELPGTGGPALLLAASGLLVGSGLLGLFVAIRRHA